MDKNKKILIVENDINTQTIYVGMLSSFGYGNVKTFCCGNDVLEYLDDNDADLIIMDIILSDEMDGVVVAQNIRKFSDIPIIFIMGTEADEFVQRAKTTDPSGYLIKPFKMEEMKTIIEIVFEKHGMQKELKKQKRLFDSILSSISEIVIVTDKDFSIIFYNDSAKQDLFYTDFIQNFLDIGLKSVENDEQFCQSMISNRYAKEYYIGEGNNKKFYEMSFKNIEIQTIEYNLITLHHITEKKNLQYNIEAQANILKKQNRELNFIISLSELIEKPGITISGMMTGIIKLLISVLSYTENAYGEIIVSGRVYSSHPIKKTLNHSRTLMIYAFGQVKGKLVFGYQSDNSNVDFENLLDDEMQLINSVLENIQKSIERRIFHSNLSKTLSFERAIYEMSSRLISEDFDLINDGVIKDLGTLLNSKSINLILFNDKEFKIDKYHSWSKNDVESENVVDFKRNFNEYKWVIDRLRNNKFVKWFSYDDIPFEAIKEKEFFKNIDFTSIIMFPIFIRKEFRGVIAFWGVKEGRKWKNNFLTLLHMFCDNIANNLETREYQQTINNQLEFQKTLVDTVPNPIYYKNKEGQFTGWNKEFEKFCNKPAAEISNKSGVEIFGSEYGKQLNDYELNLLKNAGVIRYEHIFKENFSKPRNVIISKASYFSGNGEVAGVVGSIIDITAQKNAEKEIASANERNELIISSMSSFLIDLDGNGNIVHWNPKAEQIFGIEVDRAFNCNFFDLDIAWNWETINTTILKAKDLKTAQFIKDFRFKTTENKDGFLDLSITPFKAKSDGSVELLILGRNVTHQKLLENQLVQSQKLEAVGQLAAGIAHEINSPAQFVDTNIRFLQDSFADLQSLIENLSGNEDVYKILKSELEDIDYDFLKIEIPDSFSNIIEGLKRISTIVSAMKDFSHPGIDSKDKADLNKAILSTITIARNEWKYYSDLETDLDPTLPLTLCYIDEINQVLLNMIVNSTHSIEERYGNKKSGLIKISTSFDDEFVKIEIIDNGKGIKEEIQSQIFDPFFTTKEVGRGTGQGLAISYDVIVTKHSGKLSVESKEGNGAKFTILLPRYE